MATSLYFVNPSKNSMKSKNIWSERECRGGGRVHETEMIKHIFCWRRIIHNLSIYESRLVMRHNNPGGGVYCIFLPP